MSNYQVDICHVQTSQLLTLSSKETLALLKQYKETKKPQINEQIMMGNLKLVLSMVSRYKQDELDDLFQVGCIGLLKAIEQFDLNQAVMFSTYAVPLIVGEIKAHLRSRNVLHISRYLRDLSLKVSRLKEAFYQSHHREMNKEEIMKELNISSFDLYQVENMHIHPTSLSEPKGGQEHLTIAEIIEDPKMSTQRMNDLLCLKDALQQLSTSEKWLIEQRYYKDKTQSEVAEELFLSQAQVSRMEKKVLQHLKTFFI